MPKRPEEIAMNRHHVAIPVFLLAALSIGTPTMAAEALPPADQSKPVTTARVGGSPADQAFRTATQESADRYRAERAACRTKPSAERRACVSTARSELKRARLEAKAVHDAAHEKAR
jgi:hypothetical protein